MYEEPSLPKNVSGRDKAFSLNQPYMGNGSSDKRRVHSVSAMSVVIDEDRCLTEVGSVLAGCSKYNRSNGLLRGVREGRGVEEVDCIKGERTSSTMGDSGDALLSRAMRSRLTSAPRSPFRSVKSPSMMLHIGTL